MERLQLDQEKELSAQSIFDCMVILVNAGLCVCPTKKGLTFAYMEYVGRQGQSSEVGTIRNLKHYSNYSNLST